jgi:dihydrofolate synthase/folylpolyglutamate synthase
LVDGARGWLPKPLASLPSVSGHFGSEGLARLRRALARLGDPDEALLLIHITGTNGKGSTAAMLDAILIASGRRVGLFTSPHLVDPRERIQVGRLPVTDEDLARLVPDLQRALSPEAPPSVFELWTLAALLHFARVGVDVGILEAGLGGRFDATNVIRHPLATAITTVGPDHLDRLGPTLADVAWHKAGILKPNVPAFLGRAPARARAVVEEEARRVGAPLAVLGRDFSAIPAPGGVRLDAPLGDVPLGLAGLYQCDNAALAAQLALRLGVPADAVRRGLAQATWPGRLALLDGGRIILDGAHNEEAARALAASLGTLYPGERFSLVFGALRDHDASSTAAPLYDLAVRIAVVPADPERGREPEKLAALLPGARPYALPDALDWARAFPERVLVTGSLYLVGAVYRLLTPPPATPGTGGTLA